MMPCRSNAKGAPSGRWLDANACIVCVCDAAAGAVEMMSDVALEGKARAFRSAGELAAQITTEENTRTIIAMALFKPNPPRRLVA
jgi:hypothetical protein